MAGVGLAEENEMNHTLYDEIGGVLETGVATKNLKKRAKFWHQRGYAEVYVDGESLPSFEGETPAICTIA